jgi:hypothetical protein
MNRITFAFALLALAGGVAAAQAPRITPAGDPSVRADTIYQLAVDPADHPGEDFVYLLDDGVLRFEAEGRASRTYRQVVQVLSKEGAERWGEQTFGYTADREKLTINWIRVLSLDGKVIAAGPTHEQESLAPVALEAPVYSDSKIRRVTIGGIAPGTLLDFSWTTEQFKPVLPGDFYSGWRVTTGRLVRRSRFVVDVPELLTPRLREENWRFPRQETTRGGRRTYVWATNDVPPVDGEPYAATPNSVYVGITVAGRIGWADIARWYHGLSKDRYALTPELEARLVQVVAGAKTLDDSLRAVHRWVAQDFRYVSLSLGIGGYQPRTPAAVLQTQYGDCKDKATLFVALARRLGAQAFPVLLAAGGGVERDLPSIAQFDHMIAAVALPGGGTARRPRRSSFWVSCLASSEFALMVHPDVWRGSDSAARPASANRTEIRIEGELSPQGVLAGAILRPAREPCSTACRRLARAHGERATRSRGDREQRVGGPRAQRRSVRRDPRPRPASGCRSARRARSRARAARTSSRCRSAGTRPRGSCPSWRPADRAGSRLPWLTSSASSRRPRSCGCACPRVGGRGCPTEWWPQVPSGLTRPSTARKGGTCASHGA